MNIFQFMFYYMFKYIFNLFILFKTYFYFVLIYFSNFIYFVFFLANLWTKHPYFLLFDKERNKGMKMRKNYKIVEPCQKEGAVILISLYTIDTI